MKSERFYKDIWPGGGGTCFYSRHMLLFPALGRQRQEALCEYMASLVYRVSSRATWRKTVLEKKNKRKEKRKKGKKRIWLRKLNTHI